MRKLVFLSICLFNRIIAQTDSNYINSKYKFGFNIGYDRSLGFARSNNNIPARINNGNGLLLGLVTQFELNDHWRINPNAEVHFNNCSIIQNSGLVENTIDVFPIYNSFNLHLQYHFVQFRSSPYFYAGPNYKILVRNTVKPKEYFCKANDIAFDIGMGFQKNQNYFAYAPEIRYSIGLSNINKDPDLKRIYFHTVSLLLNIQGL